MAWMLLLPEYRLFTIQLECILRGQFPPMLGLFVSLLFQRCLSQHFFVVEADLDYPLDKRWSFLITANAHF